MTLEGYHDAPRDVDPLACPRCHYVVFHASHPPNRSGAAYGYDLNTCPICDTTWYSPTDAEDNDART